MKPKKTNISISSDESYREHYYILFWATIRKKERKAKHDIKKHAYIVR